MPLPPEEEGGRKFFRLVHEFRASTASSVHMKSIHKIEVILIKFLHNTFLPKRPHNFSMGNNTDLEIQIA